MTPATRWALVAGVLALAALVAVLPLVNSSDEQTPASEDLGPVRQAADVRPCPSGQQAVGELRGVEAVCLADGSTVDVGAVAGADDRPTLVNVWATWCQPCREELPLLDAYADEPGAARVLTVQVASGQREGLELLDELGVDLPGVFDGEGESGPVREALSVPRALPASYLVSPDGEVELVRDPRLFTSAEQIREVVRSATGPTGRTG
ncbi:TlpA family protein disulfide reductase [Prauserella rugosa]|uniref:Thiol-disulfide isomerase/thioredoxin n=1 Tax=Prauserella rugosa TaxID=43354 RepID=A0A660CH66_9PSEU|nr:TlpA disulfide reductase family protein [Prauserella rugosa]KMS86049.1 redoxin [Streptomyces regensis]TWH21217.1 thiol-disulfide isomerase/thioredoxin [Prauserella rugosa]